VPQDLSEDEQDVINRLRLAKRETASKRSFGTLVVELQVGKVVSFETKFKELNRTA